MDTKSLKTTDFNFPKQKAVYHGKVRDIYTVDENIFISIATDRISAFDVILPRAIPYKGQVLNQLAAYFLEATKTIIPNWLDATPDPVVSIGKKAEPFKVEVVVRGALVGHAWREYNSGKRMLSGAKMADGLNEYDMLPSPIITPTSKADEGHDEDITEKEVVQKGLATDEEWAQISNYAFKLFAKGQEMANTRGLILADTKYEFGKLDGKIILIDEIHTPDSSRYFYKNSYDDYVNGSSDNKPKHLSKELVREWLTSNGFDGHNGNPVPNMDDEFVKSVTYRYIELFEELTGTQFEPADNTDIATRIEQNILNYLQETYAAN